MFNKLLLVHFTSFTLGDKYELNLSSMTVFCQCWKSKLLPFSSQFPSGPIHTIKLKLTGDVNVIPPSPEDILTKNFYFPFGLLWFCCYHLSDEGVIHCPLPFNGGNNCQPTWTVMLAPRKNLFNHGP